MDVLSPNSTYGLTGSFTSPLPHQLHRTQLPDSDSFSSLPAPDGTPRHSKLPSTPTSPCLLAQYTHNSECLAAPACPSALEHPHIPGARCPGQTHAAPHGLHVQHPHTSQCRLARSCEHTPRPASPAPTPAVSTAESSAAAGTARPPERGVPPAARSAGVPSVCPQPQRCVPSYVAPSLHPSRCVRVSL